MKLRKAFTPPKAVRDLIEDNATAIVSLVPGGGIAKELIISALTSVSKKTAENITTASPFTSRKLILTVAFALLVTLNAKLGHFLSNEDLLFILGGVGGFVGVEGVADIVGRLKIDNTESDGE